MSGWNCAIALLNTSHSIALSSVFVTMFNSEVERLRIGPVDLAPDQELMLNPGIEENTRCYGDDVFYIVSYTRSGIRNETLLSPEAIAANSTPNTWVATGIGGIIGVVAAIVGGWWTHLLTLARERRTASKQKYDRLEGLINQFMISWRRSIVPQELRTQFNQLQSQATLRQDVVASYMETYQVFADPKLNNQEKTDQATKFEQSLVAYLRSIDPDQKSSK
jgi:hypothetical protein